jgi:hypothetical protein
MVKARKYFAKVALHINQVGKLPKIAILEESFAGRDTWASPQYRKSPAEIDRRVRNETIHDLIQIIKFGTDIFHTPGRGDFNKEIIPQNFSGIVICDVRNESNNINGVIRAYVDNIQRFPYVSLRSSQRELAKVYMG